MTVSVREVNSSGVLSILSTVSQFMILRLHILKHFKNKSFCLSFTNSLVIFQSCNVYSPTDAIVIFEVPRP